MPFYVFLKTKETIAWTLKGSFNDYGSARIARDNYMNESTNSVARMVKAQTEGEARGKNGTAWNAISYDSVIK